VNRQVPFGGIWTDQKLQVLSGYLREYRKIFQKNLKASYYEITYLDAFAGAGKIPRRERALFEPLLPELELADEEFRKGSVRRALDVDPPFHHYVFIEKHVGKADELALIAEEFPSRKIEIIRSDANVALIEWCKKLDPRKERAVVFMDPFGTCVEWSVIETLARTKALDLWILFPCGAINRMLPSNRKPRKSWSKRLTLVFGTDRWQEDFYTVNQYDSLLEEGKTVKEVRKTKNPKQITAFFVARMQKIFSAVAEPGYLYNSKGPLFALIFAAGNLKGAGPGKRIAEHLLRRLN